MAGTVMAGTGGGMVWGWCGRCGSARDGRRGRRPGLAGLLLLLLPFILAAPAAAQQAPLHAWVQLVPHGAAQARAIVPAGQPCPALEIDGRARPMRLRAPAEGTDFPVSSCEAELPADAASLSVGGRALPLPAAAPRRIALLGDTGCRIKKDEAQACDDPAAWPFAALARAVAAAQPDLVIHLGDYLYRESPCPGAKDGCAGSPWGYDWVTWQADFFAPAAPALAAAPFLFVRGNHEGCGRAWRGWFRFLAPDGWTPECRRYSPPHAVEAAGRRLVVLDSAHADDIDRDPAQVADFAALLRAAGSLAAGAPGSWLVTHKPVWPVRKVKEADGPQPQPGGHRSVLQAAVAQAPLAPEIATILSGHYHLFQSIAFAGPGGRPNQLVLGNGGTRLDRGPAALPEGFDAWGMAVADYALLERFGFGLLEPAGEAAAEGRWRLALHDPAGAVFATCELAPFAARCAAAE